MAQVPSEKVALAKRIYFLGSNMHKFIAIVKCDAKELQDGNIPKVIIDILRVKGFAKAKSIISLQNMQKDLWKIAVDGQYEIMARKCATQVALFDMGITDYITRPTLDQVCHWVGMGRSQIGGISNREQWAESREKETNKAVDIAIAKRKEGLAEMVHKDFVRRKKIQDDLLDDFEKQRIELKKKGKYLVTNKDLMGVMSQQRSDTRLIMDIVQASKVDEYINSMKEENLLVEVNDGDS